MKITIVGAGVVVQQKGKTRITIYIDTDIVVTPLLSLLMRPCYARSCAKSSNGHPMINMRSV